MLIPKHMFDMFSKNNNLTQTNSPVNKRNKKNLFRKTAQYFLDTTYQRSRYNSIMVQDIEKCCIT